MHRKLSVRSGERLWKMGLQDHLAGGLLAAVKFGVGRYLYRLLSQWVDYDPQRKQFKQTPRLPPAA
jgi:hypothetical protein